jgi:hypothetical protein
MHKRTMLILLLAMCPATLLAGTVQGSQTDKDQGIIAALSVREETQCMDTKPRDIEVNIALTNASQMDIVIRRGVGQNVSISGLFGTRTLSPLLSAWMRSSDPGPQSAATEVIVHPGNTFAYPLTIRLDPEILKQPGFYKVQVGYDAIRPPGTDGPRDLGGETNGAIFQVRECGESAGERIGGNTGEEPSENLFCQMPVSRALQDRTFTVIYQFQEKNGKPTNIRKVKNDFLPDAKFIACISGWKVPSGAKTATFSHTPPAKGWDITVSGEGTGTANGGSQTIGTARD